YEDDPIIIKGGYPYIIKPYLPVETDIDDVHFLPVEGNNVGRRHTVPINGMDVAAPYTEHIVHAIDVDNSTKDKEVYATDGNNKYLYHFIGTYGYNLIDESGTQKSPTLPQYSFFISKTKSNPKHLLYRTMKEGINWGSFTSIIGGRSDAEITVPKSVGTASNSGETNIALRFICKNDDFTDDNGNAKSTVLSMAFNESDSDSATGITEHTTQKTKANISAIYSITGKYMGTSTDNLPKGIYISNGKKHIVQ
ncbi:MAG: hypothetical protein K2H16_09700, partial [Prevotella sp.]|nr:hypothetical protein [Prevotella sp.]